MVYEFLYDKLFWSILGVEFGLTTIFMILGYLLISLFSATSKHTKEYLAKRKQAKVDKLVDTIKANSIPGKPTIDYSNLKYYKNTRKEMIKNREWLVAQTKKYPLCIEIEGFYWCVGNRAEINKMIKQLSKEIHEVEHPEGFPEEFAKNVTEIMKTAKTGKPSRQNNKKKKSNALD